MAFVKSTNLITDVALTIDNITGGTNGKVVRINGNNTVTDATWSDTASQLNAVLFKQAGIYYATGVVPEVGGLVAGASYFLGETGGAITSNPPTPSSTVRVLYVGYALNENDLFFRPGIPISG
jgi:hypothetical protein